MMGLGSKRVIEKLMHPDAAGALRRADEDICDLIVLGALLVLGAGIVTWLIVENPPLQMFMYYGDFAGVEFFFWGVVLQFLVFLGLFWFLDWGPLTARVFIVLVGVGFALRFAVAAVLAESLILLFMYLLVFGYSMSVVILSFNQTQNLQFDDVARDRDAETQD